MTTAPTVKTFDDEKIRDLIKHTDPYLRQYIKALKNQIERNRVFTSDLISINKTLRKKLEENNPDSFVDDYGFRHFRD